MPLLIPTMYYQPRGAFDPASGGGLDPDYLLWKAAVGSVGATQQTATNALIVALKGHGLWTKADRIWLYGSENATQASIDIKGLVAHTLVGTPTFTASQGYTGNSTDYINTNFVPPTNGVNYTLNSASAGAYVRNNRTSSNATSALGAATAGGEQVAVQPNTFGGGNNMSVNDPNGTAFGTPTGTSQGFYLATRVSSGSRLFYNKGAVLGSDTQATSTFAGMPAVFTLAFNNNGTAIQKGVDQIAVVWLGGALDATNNANLSTDINSYMTALGTNVY